VGLRNTELSQKTIMLMVSITTRIGFINYKGGKFKYV
jgi:hypothetical protein